MAGFDRVLDPVTKDYVRAEDGVQWKKTRTAATALHHQILGRKNEWVGDSDAGSRLHQLPRKSSRATMLLAKDILEEALARLVTARRIERVAVSIERDTRGRFVLAGSAFDVQEGELDLTPLLPGGV